MKYYYIRDFETKDREATLYLGNGYYKVVVKSKKTNKTLAEYKINSCYGATSYTALMKLCKEERNQFCPRPVRCDASTNESSSQHGGNPPPLPVSSNPTAGGNLLHSVKIKNNSIKYLKAHGSVTSVIELYGDKYTYHLPMDAYYKIKKIDDDCRALNGFPIGIKKHLKLCKKLCYDANNERYSVA